MNTVEVVATSGGNIPRRKALEKLFAVLAMGAIAGCDNNNTIKPMESVELVRPDMSVASSIIPDNLTKRLTTLQGLLLSRHPIGSSISIQNIGIIQLDRGDKNSYIMTFEGSGKYAGLHFQYTDSGFLTNLGKDYLNILKLPELLSVLEESI